MYSVNFPFIHDCVQKFTPVKGTISFSETLGFKAYSNIVLKVSVLPPSENLLNYPYWKI